MEQPRSEQSKKHKEGWQSRVSLLLLHSSCSLLTVHLQDSKSGPVTQTRHQALQGEKKLGRVITPDTWKDGARNTTESGGRKLNENKALTSKKARFDPYGKNKFAICRICKSSVHQPGSHYCQGCAYKKGICSMCGKKVLDTKNYKQTSV